jgi:hypothetical protein
MGEFMKQDPELRGRVLGDEARRSLRRVLSLRGLELTAEQEARIDEQVDIEQLHRWHDQAVTAASAEEALA